MIEPLIILHYFKFLRIKNIIAILFRMSAGNLAIVFGPNLIGNGNETDNVTGSKVRRSMNRSNLIIGQNINGDYDIGHSIDFINAEIPSDKT